MLKWCSAETVAVVLATCEVDERRGARAADAWAAVPFSETGAGRGVEGAVVREVAADARGAVALGVGSAFVKLPVTFNTGSLATPVTMAVH